MAILCLSDDGQQLLARQGDLVKVWRLDGLKQKKQLVHHSLTQAAIFSSDGLRLVSTARNTASGFMLSAAPASGKA